MARSAAARLLSSSARPFRSSHLRRRPPLLLPTPRSKTTSSNPPPPHRGTVARKPRAPAGGQEPAGPGPSLFQEISGLVEPAAGASGDPAFQPRVNHQLSHGQEALLRCAEGARRIAPESAAASSGGSVTGSIPNRYAPGGRSAEEVVPIRSATSASPRREAWCHKTGDGDAQGSDPDNISEVVQKVTEVLRSELPGLSMEQRLESLGVLYTPTFVNMVLKRCFKKRHLGMRFFNWVKNVPGFQHSTQTYNTMLYILGEARSFGAMEELMDEMDKEMCPKDIKTWTIVISSYGKARQIGKMLSTFQFMRKSGCIAVDSKVYRTILHALCNASRPELALEFYKDMPRKMEFGSDIFRLLLCSLAGSNNAKAVFFVRDDMIKSMRYPEEYCYLETLRSFCISGNIEEAQKVFSHMKNKSMANSSAFEVLLRGLCKGGRMDDALQVLEDMKSKCLISRTSFGFLIDGYLRKRECTKALELLQGMKKYGCVPLVSAYTQLMQHLFAFDQHEAACGLYEQMQEDGIQPDIVAITALIGGHIRGGHISEAWDVFRKINENGQRPTLKAYTVFIQELCKVSRPLEALKLLKEMLETDFMPSDGTFCRIICALRDKHYLEEAHNVESMRASLHLGCGPSDKVDTIDKLKKFSKSDPDKKVMTLESESVSQPTVEDSDVSLCLLCDDTGHMEQAKDYKDEDVEEIFRILSSPASWSSMQTTLERSSLHFTPNLVDAIMKQCKRNSHAALKFFSWVGRQSHYIHTAKTYNTAMKLAGCAKDFKHMRHLYREMTWADCLPTVDTWNVMICQYGNADLTKMALEAFYQMKRDGFQPDKTTYSHLIMYLSGRKGRKVDAAIKIFKEMCRAGYILDNAVVCVYLLALCECGMIAEARNSVESLCKSGFDVQVGYSIILRSLCRSDRIEEALNLFDGIEKYGCFRSQYMYGSLIHALLRKGCYEDAVTKLAEMKNAGIPQSTQIYTSLIIYFFQKRDVAKAMDLFKEMADSGCEPTVVTYSALIRGNMAMGMVSEAWDVFKRMKQKGPPPDFETYSMFMSCLCKVGRSEDALHLIHDMLDGGIIPSAVNFRTVIHGLNREGKNKLAESVLQSKWHLRRQRTFSNIYG